MLLKIKEMLTRSFFSTQPILSQDITARIERIEANQSKILELLQGQENLQIPRNTKGIHKIGANRTIYFFNNLLPSIYLNLVSVLQGVVLGLLIDEFSFYFWHSSPVTYAYLFSSFLIIVAFWYSYLSAIFDGRWPFHIYDTILFFATATAQAIAVKHVSTPFLWCFSMSVMTIFIGLIYLRQIRLVRELGIQDTFQDPNQINLRISGLRFLVYALFLMSTIALIFGAITLDDANNIFAAILALLLPSLYIGVAIKSAKEAGLDVIA